MVNSSNFQRPQRKSPVIRIAGVDTPNPRLGQTLKAGNEINLPDLTGESQQQVIRANQEVGQAVARANQAETNVKLADLQAKGFSQSGQSIGRLGAEVVNLAKIIEKRKLAQQEAENELEEQRRQQRQEQITVQARQQLQQKLGEFQQVTRKEGLNKGIDFLRREGGAVLREVSGELNPEQQKEISNLFFNSLNEAEEDLTKRSLEQMRQARDQQEQITTTEVLTTMEADLASIENARNPQEAEERINAAMEKARQLTFNNAGERERLQNVLLPVLQEIQSSAGSSADAIATARKKEEQVIKYANAVLPFVEQYNNGEIDGDQLRVQRQRFAQRFEVPELVGDLRTTNRERYQQAIKDREMLEKGEKLSQSEESAISGQQYAELENAVQGRLIHTLATNSNPQVRQALEFASRQDSTKDDASTLRSQVQSLKQDRAEFMNLQEDLFSVQEEIAKNNLEYKSLLMSEDFVPEPVYDDTTQSFVIPTVSNQVRQDLIDSGANREEVNAIINSIKKKSEATLNRMSMLRQKWSNFNINIEDLRDTSELEEMESSTRAFRDLIIQEPEPQPRNFRMRGRNQPNFRNGATASPSTPAVAPLAKSEDGSFVRPFGREDQNNITLTSPYGRRPNPNGSGTHIHNGVDYGAPAGTKVRAVQGGKVLWSRDLSGFGTTVAVETPDGRTELYAHLGSSNVSSGQEIPPAGNIGVIGKTGNATGNVLHFQVFRGKPDFSGGRSGQFSRTIDPAEYLKEHRQLIAEPRGTGTPPSQTPTGFDTYKPNPTSSNSERPVEKQRNQTNPANVALAPYKKDQYPQRNNPDHNYGYEALQNDEAFRVKVSQVANNIGIPAQWLVDLMAFETKGTFKTDIRSPIDAVGLIQFMPQTARELGTTDVALSKMSRVQQLDFVEKYLSEFKGRIKTMPDLVASVFGGNRLLNKSPEQRRTIGDGYHTFEQYLNKIGMHSGRRYKNPYERGQRSAQRLHTKPVEGCPRCKAYPDPDNFVPHYAPEGFVRRNNA